MSLKNKLKNMGLCTYFLITLGVGATAGKSLYELIQKQDEFSLGKAGQRVAYSQHEHHK